MRRRATSILFACACTFTFATHIAQADDTDLDRSYRQAMAAAAFPSAAVISPNLITIRPGNPDLVWSQDGSKVLVVTWKSQGSYEKFLKPATTTPGNPDYAIWVTAAPQVKRFCADAARTVPGKDGLDLRLKQYLGLDRNWSYDVFVEMWVDPADLFRPCVDPEINDGVCNMQFSGPVPAVKGIPSYRDFYANLYSRVSAAAPGCPGRAWVTPMTGGARTGSAPANSFWHPAAAMKSPPPHRRPPTARPELPQNRAVPPQLGSLSAARQRPVRLS